jgi:hypothetical protein
MMYSYSQSWMTLSIRWANPALGIVLQIDANGYYRRIGLWEAKEGFMSQKGIDGTSFETKTITIL